ncbi:hypothetical protein J6590_051362 [Homalodisca vitripennis]|nr:hypothetical protein J6590_051362 [Homalodisca vitripennis]
MNGKLYLCFFLIMLHLCQSCPINSSCNEEHGKKPVDSREDQLQDEPPADGDDKPAETTAAAPATTKSSTTAKPSSGTVLTHSAVLLLACLAIGKLKYVLNLQKNSLKSNVLNFALRPVDSQCGSAVMLADSILEEVYSAKFFGILFDRGLTWNNHIDHVCAKLPSGICFEVLDPVLPQSESCRTAFKNLQLLTLLSLYILETSFSKCLSKCALTRGRDIHGCETRGRDNYRTGRHRTVVYEHLPSQAVVHFINRLPNSMKNAQTPKASKARLKRFLVSKAFYSVDEFLAFN